MTVAGSTCCIEGRIFFSKREDVRRNKGGIIGMNVDEASSSPLKRSRARDRCMGGGEAPEVRGQYAFCGLAPRFHEESSADGRMKRGGL